MGRFEPPNEKFYATTFRTAGAFSNCPGDSLRPESVNSHLGLPQSTTIHFAFEDNSPTIRFTRLEVCRQIWDTGRDGVITSFMLREISGDTILEAECFSMRLFFAMALNGKIV